MNGVPHAAIVSAMRALAHAGADMCRGQMLESELVGRPDVSVARYVEMIRLKTGALFRAVCEIGAILAGADAARAEVLARYGEHLGIAFQMRDDLLAYTRPAATAGKSRDSDLANHRPTLAILLAYEASDERGRARITHALNARSPYLPMRDEVRAVVRSTGALDESRERARSHVQAARACIASFDPSPSVNMLAAVARWATEPGP